MSTICKLDELESGKAKKFAVDGVQVAVVRVEDKVYAIADTCSHANISLSEGLVWCDSLQIECFKHGSAFSLVTGKPDTLPATQPVEVFNAEVINGDVIVTRGGAQ